MKQLATLEDYNKNLSRAIEDVTSEHLKKNEVSFQLKSYYLCSYVDTIANFWCRFISQMVPL